MVPFESVPGAGSTPGGGQARAPLALVPASVARQRQALSPGTSPQSAASAASQPLTEEEALMDLADLVNLKARSGSGLSRGSPGLSRRAYSCALEKFYSRVKTYIRRTNFLGITTIHDIGSLRH